MKCFLCKSSHFEDEPTTFMVDVGNCIIIVKNVPSQVCQQCGETTYTTDVSLQLEKIVKSLRETITEVVIVNYAAQVPA